MICPECKEKVIPRLVMRGGWSSGVDEKRLMHTHEDGEPLCPVMTAKGYQPALPIQAS